VSCIFFTDPSGYARLRKGWWRVPLAIAVTVATSGAASGTLFAGTAFGTAATANAFTTIIVGGALSGGIATGSLKGAVKGGIFAAVTFGIAHGAGGKGWIGASKIGGFNFARAFAHSFVAGVSAEIDGGKFGNGFVSSLLSSGADGLGLSQIKNSFARVVANAIVAGTISEATGGKFANGAMSAAFNELGEGIISNGARRNPNWQYGDRINGQLVDAYGDPSPGSDMILRKDGVWQTSDGVGLENAFGPRYNSIDTKFSAGAGETSFLFRGTSTEVFKNTSGCVITYDCDLYGLGGALTVNASVKYSWTAYDSDSTKPTVGLFGKLALGKNGWSVSTSTGTNGNNSVSVKGAKSSGFALAVGIKICHAYKSGSCN